MAVVEQMQQGLLVWTPPSVSDPATAERLRIQNDYISTTVIRNLLNSDGLNGIRWRRSPTRFTHEAIVETGVLEVCTTLENGCRRLRTVDAEEMEALIANLDLSDANLHETYLAVARMMTDSISFGRIVTLFLFSYLLCIRLHQENRPSLIESVVEWQVEFLNENINPWLERNHNGQWSKIHNRVNIEAALSRRTNTSSVPSTRESTGQGWATAAIVGVGALLVGLATLR